MPVRKLPVAAGPSGNGLVNPGKLRLWFQNQAAMGSQGLLQGQAQEGPAPLLGLMEPCCSRGCCRGQVASWGQGALLSPCMGDGKEGPTRAGAAKPSC